MPMIQVPTAHHATINLYYEDYGSGQPIVLIHGWPLTHRAWEGQVQHLVESGYRVISYDRRGFGQSDKPWEGYDYDTLSADLKGLIDTLELEDAIIAGFSMGGGEVARYFGQFGAHKVSSAMLISAATPFMLKTDDNPNGVDMSVLDGMRENVMNDRFAFIASWREAFMSYENNKGTISQEFLDFLWNQTLPALPKAMHDCITAFGETDFREDLSKIDVPVLVVHGTDDQICTAEACAQESMKHLKHGKLELIDRAPHGLNVTHKDELNELMTGFLEQKLNMAS